MNDISDDGARDRSAQRPESEIEALLREREAELARVQLIGQVGGLQVDLRGGDFKNKRSPEYLRVHGLPPEAATETHEAWVQRIHKDDRQRTEQHFREVVAGSATDYEAEYRIVRPSDGQVRWILAKAEIERDAEGKAIRLIGAHIDITDRRHAEEQRELIARELSHRIKNIFAVVNSLVLLSARDRPEMREFAQAVGDRIRILGQTHDYVRPQRDAAADAPAQTALGLVRLLLAAYQHDDRQHIVIAGHDRPIGERTATALALVVHELATNAVKYGALSTPSGRLSVVGEEQPGLLVLTWQERDGPPVVGTPTHRGFGTIMSQKAATAQLGAAASYDWSPAGLTFTLAVPVDRLGR